MNLTPKLSTLLMTWGLCIAGSAQSLERSVIGSAGQQSGNDAWTIGEVFTSSLTDAEYLISQGFHQSFPEPDNVTENSLTASILIYPNPSRHGFYIDFSGLAGPANLDIYDAEGRLIETHQLTNSLHHWRACYAAGVYVLRVSKLDGVLLRNERLIILN